VLRLAFFQAANAARRQDPQLAGFYHRLMTEHGHCHTQACVAVARKLVERTWTVLIRGTPYQLRDAGGQPISHVEAKQQVRQRSTVPDQVRAKSRAHSAATVRAKLTRWPRAATSGRSSHSCHIRSALRRAQRGAPARRASQMTIAGRTTLSSTNADPSSSSEERPYRPARSAFGLALPEWVDNPLGNLFTDEGVVPAGAGAGASVAG
jgi:hypothetical protein